MICKTCADAAARRAPATEHCDAQGGPGARCDCQHRTDKYRPAPIPEPEEPALTAHTARVEAAIARIEADHEPDDIIRIPRAAADRCRAEFHEANRQSGHCDLPTGHDEDHRDNSVPGPLRWTEAVAMYPTDTTKG